MGFFRKPSWKRSWSNRTSLRFQLVHRLGAKMPRGMGFLRDPQKASYNAFYSRFTMSTWDAIKMIIGKGKTDGKG